MMEPFERIDIQELPLRVPSFRRKVEGFLGSNGLRLEEVDLYLAVLDAEGSILAGGGLSRDLIKCIAVSESARSMGLSVPLISRLISAASERGYTNVKVFTKPENRSVFESMGFRLLAEAPKAVLMENGRGLEEYCRYLRGRRHGGSGGLVIMNANPFTWGHDALVEQASRMVDQVYVIPVKEDASRFPYAERLDMIRSHFGTCAEVLDGSDYQISAATFPTYFLKDLSDAAETQMRLDIDLFGRHIAPALDVRRRFVGSEPSDPLTARYNGLLCELLPSYGIQVTVLPRFEMNGAPVSASRVRACLDEGSYRKACLLTPDGSHRYLKADLAARALRLEADLTPKPGLVDLDGPGAHPDMDHSLLLRSIDAIRPYFGQMASIVDSVSEASCERIRQLGIEAEQAMLKATGGINAHRGAIFALGLALAAGVPTLFREEEADEGKLSSKIAAVAAWMGGDPSSHGSRIRKDYPVRGALQMAREGYPELFSRWLPFYASVKDTSWGLHKTLLLIMSELDDTCVIHRVGYARAQEVKAEAKALLADFSIEKLNRMNERYSAERVSPGGSADMLALTVLVHSLLN